MKLLFAIKRLQGAAGGAERVLAVVCSSLADSGHSVSVMTWDPPGCDPFYAFDKKVRFIHRGIGDATMRASVGETIRRMVDARRVIAHEAPDLVIGFCHSMFIPLSLALAGCRVPVIGSEHGAMAHYSNRPLQYALFRLSARLLRAITVMSDAIKQDYTADVRSKMIVVPNPIVLPAGSHESGRSGASKMILNVGRMDHQKDQQTLIRAFARLVPEFPDWSLRIVGEGILRQKLERLVGELGVATCVSMPGVSKDIAREYTAATIFALSSRYESFGLVSVEAMSYGLPVVAFADCPGTNEVVTDGIDGVLVKPGLDRVSAFADGLRTLMSHERLRDELGRSGRQTAARRARECRSIERWNELVHAVV